MGKINVLSFEIANLIAAGEVVERPSSVLKELIENSIDAGSTQIVAEIRRGGVSLIRVTDNGCGISKEDLPVALKRHATSKISEKDDLDNILTLGFRGEALAAISSVSEVTIITKTANSECGYMLTSEGGKITDLSEVGAGDGTTVVVENLFYNVPARRKFLKKDVTEAMNVTALVEKVALSRPDISIQLLIDGQEKFKTNGDGNLLNTVRAIFGREFSSKLIEVQGECDGIKVHGFVGRSDNVRKNRNYENVFINGRYVKSITAQTALEKAFTSYIAPECFPVCALFIEMNPSVVDVNVHPAKLEVKFSDERKVFEAVYYTVKTAIEKEEYRPEISLASKRGDYNPVGAFVPVGNNIKSEQLQIESVRPVFSASEIPQRPENPSANAVKDYTGRSQKDEVFHRGKSDDGIAVDMDRPIRFSSGVGEIPPARNSFTSRPESDIITPKKSIEILDRYKASVPCVAETKNIVPSYKYVGEAFDCYIIIEQNNELLVIDKHAAHERVIFEDLKNIRRNDKRLASQSLLLPITVLLSPEEISVAKEFRKEFEAVGFDFSVNEKSVDLTSVPEAVSVFEAEFLFSKMAHEIVEGKGNPQITDEIRREKSLYQIACKAAIKGGRHYDKSVIEWLIEKVLELPDITVCPHGRPIAYKLKKSELDRQFNRIK